MWRVTGGWIYTTTSDVIPTATIASLGRGCFMLPHDVVRSRATNQTDRRRGGDGGTPPGVNAAVGQKDSVSGLHPLVAEGPHRRQCGDYKRNMTTLSSTY
ncbi:hypothetical protein BHE74_00018876 [Ensete ventricosum]|nr:hypothetical protein BHE74_00018876 [Ensete ventricosum]